MSPTEEKEPAEVESELRFISWLIVKGYPIMKPYPMKNRHLRDVISTRWGTYNVTCFEGVEGDTLEELDGDCTIACGYGRTLAELHNLSEAYSYANERKSCFDLMNEVKERFIRYGAPAFLLAALDEVQKELSLLPQSGDVFGLIHYVSVNPFPAPFRAGISFTPILYQCATKSVHFGCIMTLSNHAEAHYE